MRGRSWAVGGLVCGRFILVCRIGAEGGVLVVQVFEKATVGANLRRAKDKPCSRDVPHVPGCRVCGV